MEQEQIDFGLTSRDNRRKGRTRMKQKFQEWLVQRGNSGAARSYPGAIDDISKHYSEQTKTATDIYRITDQHVISEIAHDYSQSGRFSQFGYEQHGRFRNAIGRYSEFFVQHVGGDTLAQAPIEESDESNQTADDSKDASNNFTYERDLQTTLCAQISELFPEYKIYGNGSQGIEYSIGNSRN